MKYVLIFEDDDSHADMRPKYMAEHLQFLADNSSLIQAAGPMKDAATADPAGGLWIVDADNLGQVQTLIEEDPFWPTGLRKSIRVLEWKQVFVDGKQLI